MRNLTYLAAELLHRPLLAEPQAAARVLGVLADRLGVDAVELDGELHTSTALARSAQDSIRERREYAVQDGVATIPVIGSLASRSHVLRPASGFTGYTAIERQIDLALSDGDVRGILLEIDSPGGAASGVMDLARAVREASSIKPVWAVLAEHAHSAAYAIATGAQRIIVPRTGSAGSIGVIFAHIDRSGELEKLGRKVTIIRAGARKADASPLEPLDPEAARRIQEDVDALHEEFVGLVAEHRSLPPAAVRLQEAGVFRAELALERGLVDAIMPARQARAEFHQFVNSGRVGRVTSGSMGMSHQPGAAQAAAPTFSQADIDAAEACGREAGASGERARIAGILTHEEAAGREQLARHLAFSTSMKAEDAANVLAASPRVAAEAATPATDFAAAMARLGNAQVGPDDEATGDKAAGAVIARLASYQR